jgi:Putative Actinobacterial Holin-X, holin superfamily III
MTDDHHDRDGIANLSTAELVNHAAAQVTTLVRDELALARAELTERGKRAGIGGGLLGGAVILSWYGLGLVITLIVVTLDLVWPLWLAVLMVAGLVFAIAGLVALLGRRHLSRAVLPVPSEAAASVAADVETIRKALREGRQS